MKLATCLVAAVLTMASLSACGDDGADDEPDDDDAAAGFALPESLPVLLVGLSDGASDFLASPLEPSVYASTLAGVSLAAFLSRLSLR